MRMKKLITEFREFINRGNVMDLSVAVIMGAAFTAIITATTNDLITPLLSLLTFGINFSTLSFSVGDATNPAVFMYGNLLQAIMSFLVVSLVVFFMVKGINTLSRKKPKAPTKDCPYCGSAIADTAVRCPNCTTVLDISKVPEDAR
jgi:large conductance mechanosensitive channel